MKTQQVRSAVVAASVTLLLVACGETPPVVGAATSQSLETSPARTSAPINPTPLRAGSDASAAPVQVQCPEPTPEYLPVGLRSPESRRQEAEAFKIAALSPAVRHQFAVSVARVLDGECLEARQLLSGRQT